MTSKAPRYDDARVHLNVLGQNRDVEVRVRVGETRLVDALPLARAITDAIVEMGTAFAAEQGKTVSCRAGCGACCSRHIITVAPVEVVAIARLVRAMPPKRREAVRRRFAMALRRLEDLGMLDRHAPKGRTGLQTTAADPNGEAAWMDMSRRYAEATITCPFLEDQKCSIYADRPVVCREFLATTPAERCETFGSGVETTPRPVWMMEVLSDVSATVADVLPKGIPLLLALEWAEVHGDLLDATIDGEELFYRLTEFLSAHAQGGGEITEEGGA